MEMIGKVVQIIGPVVDCEFEEKHLPQIYNCVIIEGKREEDPFMSAPKSNSIWAKTACAVSACSRPMEWSAE